MRNLVLAAVALVAMSIVTVPSAMAQEAEKADAEKKAEKMEAKAKAQDVHWMKGTMTAPESDPVDISYAFKRTEEGRMGWIVAEDDEGEKVKMEMRDLSWGDGQLTYNWSPPDEASLVVTCSLKKQADGGFAGDCKDNQEEGRTGQMTMAPMEKKEKKDSSDG